MTTIRTGDPFPGTFQGVGQSEGRGQALQYRHERELQRFREMWMYLMALAHETRVETSQLLNQIIADTIVLYALYKNHHRLMRGPTFYLLHLLLDKYAGEQLALIDLTGERVQALGGVAIADPWQVAEVTTVPRPLDGVEEVPAMLSRLLEAHEIIITKAREAIAVTAQNGDFASKDLLTGNVLRTNEHQAWFIAENLVDVPFVEL